MSTSAHASSSKCSKPKGEYCRLHNPAPLVHHFSSVQEVLDKALTQKVASVSKQGLSFSDIEETRTLPEGISRNLSTHIAQSELQLQHLTDQERMALSGYTGFGAGVCNSVLLGNKYGYYDRAPRWRDSNGPSDFVDREDLVDYMQTMDTILAPRQKEARIIYRGTPIYAALHDEIVASVGKKFSTNDTEGLLEGLKEYYKEGKIFNYPTYLSTTHSAHYAAERTENEAETYYEINYQRPEVQGILFELKTNAGLDVTAAAHRHNAYEREVILPRDTHFKVTSVYVKPTSYDTVSGYDYEPDELEQKDYKKIAVVVQMVEVDEKGNEISGTSPHYPRKPIEEIVPS